MKNIVMQEELQEISIKSLKKNMLLKNLILYIKHYPKITEKLY